MKANELRIGNYITIPSKGGEIDQISDGHDIDEIGGSGDANPIPLTEEILLKAGFEVKQKTVSLCMGRELHLYARKDDFIIWYRKGHGWCLREIFDDRTRYITSVHELQNLAYALTGKELEINF